MSKTRPDDGRRQFTRAALAALALPLVARAQPGAADAPHKALYMYQGADREARLAAEAKKQREVVMYTSLNLKDSVPLTEAFEKKTGLKVNLWRASSEKVLQRAVTEARAGRFACDIIETNGPEMEACYREKLLEEFYSPHFKDLPAAAFPRHRHYVADRFNFFTIGYNTNLVKPEEVPNAYTDLVNPRWAGRVGLEGSDVDWFGAVVKSMGEQKGLEFFRKLASTNGISPRQGHTLLNNMVVSGEVPMALTVYNYMPEQAKKKGAPIDWFVIEPAIARANAIGIARHAQHPNAALLFYEYLLGPEGQNAMVSIDYVPTNTKVESPLKGVKIVQTDPIRSLDEADKWSKLYQDVVVKKAGAR